MNELGWPGSVDNIKPLQKILFNKYRDCVGTLNENIDKFIPLQNNEQQSKNHQSIENDSIIGEYDYNCSGLKITFPIIKSLDRIPNNMYYYYGDKNNKRGVYTRITDEILVKVPLVETISENLENSRQMVVKCNKNDECRFWNCTYAHTGVPYTKIGFIKRAPSCSGFSNFESLKNDIKAISYEDIRLCLMYSITDLFSIKAWCQHYFNENKDQYFQENRVVKDTIWKNIELCGNYSDPFGEER